MPAEDKIHKAVRTALIKDGWTITDEPFTIEYESDRFYADICALREVNAGTARRVIVVEVKSFAGASPMREFEQALGQYEIYRDLLALSALGYELYLAIDSGAYNKLILRPTFQLICKRHEVAFLIVEATKGDRSMDKRETYAAIIRETISRSPYYIYGSKNKAVETEFICDDAKGQYLLLDVGWRDGKRAFNPILYVRIKNDKIWMEEDWTENGITDDLMRAGVPKEDIVLAFHSPEMRPYTDFAVS